MQAQRVDAVPAQLVVVDYEVLAYLLGGGLGECKGHAFERVYFSQCGSQR